MGISGLMTFFGDIRSPLGGGYVQGVSITKGWGGYVLGWGPPPELGPWMPRDTVDKGAVRILLECCLVIKTRLSII